MSEIMIEKWEELFYVRERDMYKDKKFLEFLDSILFMFLPIIHLSNCGYVYRTKIKLLDTKTNKTRIITEKLV